MNYHEYINAFLTYQLGFSFSWELSQIKEPICILKLRQHSRSKQQRHIFNFLSVMHYLYTLPPKVMSCTFSCHSYSLIMFFNLGFYLLLSDLVTVSSSQQNPHNQQTHQFIFSSLLWTGERTCGVFLNSFLSLFSG